MSGVRPLRLNLEKNRLLPLFNEVYGEAVKIDKNLPNNITLYMQENMEINALAFGKTTFVLTRSSIELSSDECIKGLIAHELDIIKITRGGISYVIGIRKANIDKNIFLKMVVNKC